MIADSAAIAACENLKSTYFELGKAASASRTWQETGFNACIGDFAHPICNFAAGLNLDFVSAGRLADLAVSRPCFHIYNMLSDVPSDCGQLLEQAGFHKSYTMDQMIGYGVEAAPVGNLVRSVSYSERRETSLFMVEQFFARQEMSLRRKIAEATARAMSLELLEYRKGNQVLGAVMISLSGGMAGIYNLCVEGGNRNLGIGSKIVLEILAVCGSKGLNATLQCEPRLQSWYGKLGFRRCGCVQVFSFPTPASSVIMQ